MLTKVHLKCFKAIEDSGEILLEPLNVFIGRNGSGKSSVVEFLELVANAVEFDIATAASPFRRGRDVVRCWNATSRSEASISLSFDPGDVSAGDSVNYELGLEAPGDGETLQIATERLWTQSADSRGDVILTEKGARFYRVPPTRIAGRS